MSRIARMRPETEYVYTSIGGQGDAVDEGVVYVKLKPKTERTRSQLQVVADIRSELVQMAGITTSISTGFNPGEKQIQLQVRGPDATELTRLAQAVATEMRKMHRGRWMWRLRRRDKNRNSTPKSIDRLPAPRESRLARSPRPCGRHLPASTLETGSTRRERPETSPSDSPRSRAPSSPISNRCRCSWEATTMSIPLGQVARVTPSIGPARIDHLDRDRVVNVEANTENRALSAVVATPWPACSRL